VYCLERQDCAGLEPENVALVLNASRPESIIREDFDAEHGHWVLSLPARRREAPATTQAALYEPVPAASTDLIQVSTIPFYFRANRQEDTRWMTWIPYESR